MSVLFGTIGLLGIPICGIWFLINFFRKKEYKKQAIGVGIFVLCFIIGVAITPTTDTQTTSTETTSSEQFAFSEETTTIETTVLTENSTIQSTQLTEHETYTTAADIPAVANNTNNNNKVASNTTVKTATTTKAKTTKATTAKKATTPAGDLQSGQVYIPEKGKRYHYDKSCSNGNYTAVAKSSAINRGYTPCKKCAGG